MSKATTSNLKYNPLRQQLADAYREFNKTLPKSLLRNQQGYPILRQMSTSEEDRFLAGLSPDLQAYIAPARNMQRVELNKLRDEETQELARVQRITEVMQSLDAATDKEEIYLLTNELASLKRNTSEEVIQFYNTLKEAEELADEASLTPSDQEISNEPNHDLEGITPSILFLGLDYDHNDEPSLFTIDRRSPEWRRILNSPAYKYKQRALAFHKPRRKFDDITRTASMRAARAAITQADNELYRNINRRANILVYATKGIKPILPKALLGKYSIPNLMGMRKQ